MTYHLLFHFKLIDKCLFFNSGFHVADPYTIVTFIAHNISEGTPLIKPG